VKPEEPTPEEIARRAAEIRAGWVDGLQGATKPHRKPRKKRESEAERLKRVNENAARKERYRKQRGK
jgi:hypothetical protein